MERNYQNINYPYVVGVLDSNKEIKEDYGLMFCHSFGNARRKIIIFSNTKGLQIQKDELYFIDEIENGIVIRSWYYESSGSAVAEF